MSQKDESTFVCDCCGLDVGNGSVLNAVLIHDLDPNIPGGVKTYHLCRDQVEGKKIIEKGCSRKTDRILKESRGA